MSVGWYLPAQAKLALQIEENPNGFEQIPGKIVNE